MIALALTSFFTASFAMKQYSHGMYEEYDEPHPHLKDLIFFSKCNVTHFDGRTFHLTARHVNQTVNLSRGYVQNISIADTGNATFVTRELHLEEDEIRVFPGETFQIQLTNDLMNDMNTVRQGIYNQRSRQISYENIPGLNFPFGSMNIHLHGMQVVPHLFRPIGTINPDAPWIVVNPNQTVCYRFYLPDTHPSGSFFIHAHLHGTVMAQLYSNIFVPIEVGHQLKSLFESAPTKTIETLSKEEKIIPKYSVHTLIVSQVVLDEKEDRLGDWIPTSDVPWSLARRFVLINNSTSPAVLTQEKDETLIFHMIGILFYYIFFFNYIKFNLFFS